MTSKIVSIKIVGILVVLFLCGCNSKEPFHGSVLFEDGQPLAIGTVCLSDGLHLYQGVIQQNGSFQIGEFRDGDGIPPGNYTAWIANANTIEYILNAKGERTGKTVEHKTIADKYTSPDTSGLTFSVETGQKNNVELTVTKP